MAWMNVLEAAGRLPGILFRGETCYDFDGIPMPLTEMSWRKRTNLLKAGVDMVMNKDTMYALPPVIQIEPTNICNLRCPLCPTGSGSLPRKPGMMEYSMVERLLTEVGEDLGAVYFFCFGEPFLNKDLPRMIRACTDRGIITLTSTNGQCCQTMEDAVRVVDSGLTTLIVALDGSTQESYEKYRKGGDIEKVKRFVSLIEEAKKRRNSPYPYTVLRAVVMKENAGELDALARTAVDWGVNMFATKTVGCLVTSEEFHDHEPVETEFRRFEYARVQRGTARMDRCIFPFRQPIIFCDGTVVGCEYDHELEMAFGSLIHTRFVDIWNSDNAKSLRKAVRSGKRKPGFCLRCPYENNVRRGTRLDCKELRPVHFSSRIQSRKSL